MRRRSRRKYQMGGRSCGGPGQPPCSSERGGYRRGGRVNSRRRGRRFQAGGHAHNVGHSHAIRDMNTQRWSDAPIDYSHYHKIENNVEWGQEQGQQNSHGNFGYTGLIATGSYNQDYWGNERTFHIPAGGSHRHTLSGPGNVSGIGSRRNGGRINYRMQEGGRAGGGLDNKRKTQKIDNKGRKR